MTTEELQAALFPKGRPHTRKQLKAALHRVMSFYVVLRDGMQCVTCGRRTRLTASHLFKRGHDATAWMPMNLFCQCDRCNGQHNRDSYPLTRVFLQRYGQENFDWVHKQWAQVSHLKLHNLQEKLDSSLVALVALLNETGVPLEDVDAVRLKFTR